MEPRRPATLAVFAATLFLGATLLFLVQPMVGKMLLPLLGGSPAVWTTCMVFFQAALLAGYAYAHAAPARLGLRRQALWHLVILLIPLAQLLFFGLTLTHRLLPPADGNPVLWVLAVLVVSVGLPFFAVSTTAPLLQKWFAGTGHPSAKDPYFLYGASNLGSMLALLAYPALIEPTLRLADQAWLWSLGYGLLVVLTAVCAWLLWRSPDVDKLAAGTVEEAVPPLTLSQRLHWVALAFVPSSLMLGVTMYLTTDVAPIPLLWVLPLAVYLGSFILVFSHLPAWVYGSMVIALPVTVLLLLFLMLSGIHPPIGITIALHLLALFVVSTVCHGELARRRPASRHLTEFYLLLAAGGALGGLFNGIVAPLVFSSLIEYPLALVLACLLLPNMGEVLGMGEAPVKAPRLARVLDLVLPLFVAGLTAALVRVGQVMSNASPAPGLTALLPAVLAFGVPPIFCYLLIERSVRFGLGVAAFWLTALACSSYETTTLYQDRNFFGTLMVHEEGEVTRLVHGTTIHGLQHQEPELRREPMTYYTRTGPIGQVFALLPDTCHDVGIIGLGAGTLATYGEKGDRFTYYEIDERVIRIASTPGYFTFLADAKERNVDVRVVLGDARIELEKQRLAPDEKYTLLVVDAFTSDAIPLHLITRQAVRLYFDRIRANGIVAFHVSNRYLKLEPVLANIAEAEDLVALAEDDDGDERTGKFPSSWVLLARKQDAFGPLMNSSRWRSQLQQRPGVGVWTDDYSNVLGVFNWGS